MRFLCHLSFSLPLNNNNNYYYRAADEEADTIAAAIAKSDNRSDGAGISAAALPSSPTLSSSSEDPIAPISRRHRVAASELSSAKGEGPALGSLNSLPFATMSCETRCPPSGSGVRLRSGRGVSQVQALSATEEEVPPGPSAGSPSGRHLGRDGTCRPGLGGVEGFIAELEAIASYLEENEVVHVMRSLNRNVQNGPAYQGPSQHPDVQDDRPDSEDNRLQTTVPSGVSTQVNYVTPNPIDQGTTSLAGQEIRSVSGTKWCSSASDDTEDINSKRGLSASSLNPLTKRTKVQEAGKRTNIVPPKRRGSVLSVKDTEDDDEDNKSIGSVIPSTPSPRIDMKSGNLAYLAIMWCILCRLPGKPASGNVSLRMKEFGTTIYHRIKPGYHDRFSIGSVSLRRRGVEQEDACTFLRKWSRVFGSCVAAPDVTTDQTGNSVLSSRGRHSKGSYRDPARRNYSGRTQSVQPDALLVAYWRYPDPMPQITGPDPQPVKVGMTIHCSLVEETGCSIVYGFKPVYIRRLTTKLYKIAAVKGRTLKIENGDLTPTILPISNRCNAMPHRYKEWLRISAVVRSKAARTAGNKAFRDLGQVPPLLVPGTALDQADKYSAVHEFDTRTTMRVSDIRNLFKAKSKDQAIFRDLLKEILQSKPIYTEQIITPTVKQEIQDDINHYVHRMPQCIKAKYDDDELAISVKNAMKKDRRTPTPGRSQTPQTGGHSSEPAVTPGPLQATQPQMLTQFALDTYDQAHVQWQEAIEDYTAYLDKGR
ncbi:uncharacterized protein P174DRAFT_432200 [Aspergillus novofumigatus IBT 16806]|uniref:Uncharacterized protein n=1 Tax=Aspergillus novofumigatus (strain IBT 16806) TaxID=1392255 RepID=A0A2I1C5E2_ASPN1|nr:uncharacterized protein P174DRAFT_432200 [Aspergillus novofumigatus IBT 16806]PKX92827.1 hypothetical protein P174DRAFT_432200 [Aspergillus novofumigatus IBT 16806]